ncbi:hypothetical protein [Oculatella sp. LEGE 06141]|nr:hypothetical protein [Oculatella sp. LEGE 06141]
MVLERLGVGCWVLGAIAGLYGAICVGFVTVPRPTFQIPSSQ